MDPFALANLPLTGLALVALFWVFIQFISWASKRVEHGQRLNVQRDYMRYYTCYFSGSLVNLLPQITMTMEEAIERANQSGKGSGSDSDLSDKGSTQTAPLVGLFESVIGIFSAPGDDPSGTAKAKPAESFIFTDGSLDLKNVSEHLHEYSAERADLIMYLIEMKPYLIAKLTQINELSTKPSELEHYIMSLRDLQFDVTLLALVTRALHDDAFRKKFRAKIDIKEKPQAETRIAKALALAALVKEVTDDEFSLKLVWKNDDEKIIWAEVDETNVNEALSIFNIPALNILSVKRYRNIAKLTWLVPVAYALTVGFVLVTAKPIRDLLYPPEIPVFECTTTISKPSGERKTTCAHSAETLQTGFDAGASLKGE